MYKIKFTRATTLRGKPVKPGDTADVDLVTYQTLKGQNQAELYVDPKEVAAKAAAEKAAAEKAAKEAAEKEAAEKAAAEKNKK